MILIIRSRKVTNMENSMDVGSFSGLHNPNNRMHIYAHVGYHCLDEF